MPVWLYLLSLLFSSLCILLPTLEPGSNENWSFVIMVLELCRDNPKAERKQLLCVWHANCRCWPSVSSTHKCNCSCTSSSFLFQYPERGNHRWHLSFSIDAYMGLFFISYFLLCCQEHREGPAAPAVLTSSLTMRWSPYLLFLCLSGVCSLPMMALIMQVSALCSHSLMFSYW